MRIAVIPARGGSKRIPRKNIKPFNGKPMIAWSIEAARTSGLFDHVIVSTDDAEISEIASEWGAEVPFVRPPELSNDIVGTTEVIAHATKWTIDQGINVSAVCCIYATAPLIQNADIRKGSELLASDRWDYVFAASELDSQVFRSFVASQEFGVEMILPQYFASRTQDLPVAMQDAAQFYWGKPSAWISNKRIFDKHSTCVTIPSWRVRDIDTLDDWVKAEIIFNQIRGKDL